MFLIQQSRTLALFTKRMIHAFIVENDKGILVFLILYLDDILIIGRNIQMLKSVKE